MKVLKKYARYIIIIISLIGVTIPIFTIGENETTTVENLISQEEEMVENTAEPIETITPTIEIPTQTSTPYIEPDPTMAPASTNWGTFKSYMHYTSITLKGSSEYYISRTLSQTDPITGVRIVIENEIIYYCIAIGTGWGYQIGDKLKVVLDNGNTFYAIMTDTKANKDTKNDNKTMKTDNSVVEFVVGKPKEVRKYSWYYHGTLGVLKQFNGGIVSIEKI